MMNTHPAGTGNRGTRRAAALLLTLAVLVIAVTATAMLARAAGTVQMRARLDRRDSLTIDLIEPIDQIILQWLKSEAGDIVLPPHAAEPMVAVLHDVISSETIAIEITITAWDQCGMAPLDMLRSGLPVRGALPPSVLDHLDDSDAPQDAASGLDLFVNHDRRRPAAIAIFPAPPETPPMIFTSDQADTAAEAISGGHRSAQPAGEVSGVGGVVATHNPAPSPINVNTAPRPVLEAIMRDLGRGGIEQIMTSRENSKKAAAAGAPRRDEDRSAAAHLVDQSSAWAFRIEVTVDSFRRSWWAVYSNRDQERSRRTTWKCVQRIAITE